MARSKAKSAAGTETRGVHAPEGGGFLFKYLDGTTWLLSGAHSESGRWREPTAENPTCYQIP